LKIKGIAECLYKDGDVMESGNPEQYKQCSAKIIRAVFTRSEMAEKRRPGDIFYGLSAVAFLLQTKMNISSLSRISYMKMVTSL
jgi:hypothetical protein